MAKFIFQLNLFLMLLLTALQTTLVSSIELTDFDSIPINDQQIFEGAITRPGESVICNSKQSLIHNLEQLSFYLKADCQDRNRSAVGCSCWPPRCARGCTPTRACCAQNTTALVAELEGFNAFYAVHFKELFGGAPQKCAQLEE
ncbi:hypothetical protein G647_05924 [Cladophialophora carrionii CBS 160.54]|uniref:Hydrophobin n=1 Tax=Cladophialophora carrionii CBS 160.54 TaxID=1279043 RepID=V9D4S7_9EURO|nr:uncharacterized protein G647_05924 [Cladophialophora carrionii CBS 160.54]ETI21855.1 hypothetical protein G647_05924 [Cladophialophora carrionii CBS 160.54]